MSAPKEFDCRLWQCPYYGIVDDPACLGCVDNPKREVTNVPLQGDTTVDEIVQLSVTALQRCLREQGFVAEVVTQIHDGVTLKVRKAATVEKERTDMKVYKGTREGPTAAHTASVRVHPKASKSYPLPWRLDLRNHSPTGLNWGYGGSGPAQCALAILADHLDDDQEALKWYHSFKSAVVAGLRIDKPWELTSDQIERVLTRFREGKAR